jgi:hypothetical protein
MRTSVTPAADDTAATILRSIGGADAVTLAGGYAVVGTVTERGVAPGRVMFEPARIVEERRNEQGRCTLFVGRYKDGSGIRFTWNPARGHRYERLAA